MGESNRELVTELNEISRRLNEFYEEQQGIKVSTIFPVPLALSDRIRRVWPKMLQQSALFNREI